MPSLSIETAMKDLLVIENGERVAGTFSEAEMAGRLARLRAHMAAHEIDAVLFTSMHNIHYFSDFLYCSFGRPYGLAVTPGRATVIAANIDFGQPWRRTGQSLTYTDWRRDNYVRAVQQLIGEARRIGVELDHITVENLDKLNRPWRRPTLSTSPRRPWRCAW
jgi:creatinase